MRCQSLFALSLGAVASASFFGSKPDLDIKATFGEANPFAQVTNGQSNSLFITLESHASKDLTIQSVSGSFHEKDRKGRERHLKNTTQTKYDVTLPAGEKKPVRVTYKFHSEFKPRELGLTVWVDYVDSDKAKHRDVAYEGQVTIVEPKGSWFDPALLFAFTILLGLLGFGGMIAYNTYVPAGKKGRINLLNKTEKPAAPISAEQQAKESEDWIPSHHAKKRRNGAANSDGDQTDPEYASTGSQKRKGKAKAK